MITILKVFIIILGFQWILLFLWLLFSKPASVWYRKKMGLSRLKQNWDDGGKILFFSAIIISIGLTIFAIKIILIGRVIDFLK